MFVMSFLMKGLDRIDEQREKALDNLILRTTYYGLDGKAAAPGKPTWAMVYESMRRNNNGTEKTGTGKAKENK